MKALSDNALIEMLRTKDNGSIEVLYRLLFPPIASFIKQNNGSVEDAKDNFQETILILLEKVCQPDFQLTSSLKTYIYSISRNLWLKRLRDNKSISVDDFERFQLQCEQEDLELKPESTREEKVSQWITRITQHCQRILKAIFFYNEPMEKLMKTMGWKNRHTAANQQYKCIQQIKKIKERET